ncbi:MAG: hypothetical protein H3Z49_05815 [archaeon]|nr:hypothetical protein [archaeon]
MPKASDNASAMAIATMPPMTAIFELVLAYSPTIMPKVVITPEAKPKQKPFIKEIFIG